MKEGGSFARRLRSWIEVKSRGGYQESSYVIKMKGGRGLS